MARNERTWARNLRSDKEKFRSDLNRAKSCERSEPLLKTLGKSGDFQAEYEGSIPFTRSNVLAPSTSNNSCMSQVKASIAGRLNKVFNTGRSMRSRLVIGVAVLLVIGVTAILLSAVQPPAWTMLLALYTFRKTKIALRSIRPALWQLHPTDRVAERRVTATRQPESGT